jgi:hypothetical protein
MIAMKVAITANTAEPAIGAVQEICQPENLLPILAETVADAMRENFMMLDSTRPNKLGGERQHYYAGAANRTDWEQKGSNRAIVYTDQTSIVIRYFGGTIRAGAGTVQCGPNAGQPTQFLTIPVTAEAYGRRACDFPGLKVLWGRNGPYGLGRVSEGSIAHETGSGMATTNMVEVLFVLKREVEIPADDTLLPSGDVINERLSSVFLDTINNVTEMVQQGIAERGQQALVESALEYAAQQFTEGGDN